MGQNLCRQVQASIKTQGLMRAGDRVAAAVSGGADSVALLLLLLELREELGIVPSVAHFNHKLRGKASEADERFVAKLAAKHGLALYLERADVAARAKRERSNLEDTARRARYEFFEGLVQSGHVTRIAVAHTADDQAETVVAHILRGTGLTGLGGIHPVVGHVVRPLLEVRRTELRAYLRSSKQNWREDATNLDTTRTRARIRKKLLPLLEKEFQPAVVRHLAALAELAREDEAFLEALTEKSFAGLAQRNSGMVRIPVEGLLSPEKPRQLNTENAEGTEKHKEGNKTLSKRLVRRIVQEVKPYPGQLSAVHVHAVLELAESGQNGKSLRLPGGVEVRRERDSLIFCARRGNEKTKPQAKSTVEFEHKFDTSQLPADIAVPQLGCVFRFRVIDWPAKTSQTSNRDCVLDRDALRFPLVLRNWRPGDRLQSAGRRGAHKLKRLLNNKRVSRWEREGWPVLTSAGYVAWARGFPVAAEFAPNDTTRAGLVIVEEKI